VLRPNTGEPLWLKPAVKVELGSSHAPAAGMAMVDAARRYSAAWQRCAPGYCASHAWCIDARPAIVGMLLVSPTNWTLGTPLQQASARTDVQFALSVMPPSGSTWVPYWPLKPDVQFWQS